MTQIQSAPIVLETTPIATAQANQVSRDLGFVSSQKLTATATSDPQAVRAAEEWASRLFNCDSVDQRKQAQQAVNTLADGITRELATKHKMLGSQISVLAQSAESSPIAKSLINLKVQVDSINPSRYTLLAPGSVGRLFSWVPGVGTTLNSYFTRYQSAGAVIESIVYQLKAGAAQLERDIEILSDDQTKMRELTIRLQKTIQAAILLDGKLSEKINLLDPQDEKRKFLEEEVLFALRQRIQDLQQNLAVNQQGVISYEIIIRNNRELIRGARRCEDVTVKALQIGVVVALALANQRIVLKTIQAIDTTTNDLLLQNANMLKTQGVDVHKMATQQSLSMENLKTCFADLTSAMDDIEKFKQEALPQMAEQIKGMSEMSEGVEKVITKMERGNAQRPQIILELAPTGKPNV